MDSDKIIDLMFDELENSGALELKKHDEYIRCLKLENKIGTQVFDYMRKVVKSKRAQKKLTKLIDSYIDSCRDTTYVSNKYYYKQGFINGIIFVEN